MTLTPDMINLIFLLIAAEFAGIAWLLVRARLGGLISPVFFFLASGALLFACLKIALSDGSPEALSLAGGGAFFTHIAAIALAARAVARLRGNGRV